jgi:hypothetical protein
VRPVLLQVLSHRLGFVWSLQPIAGAKGKLKYRMFAEAGHYVPLCASFCIRLPPSAIPSPKGQDLYAYDHEEDKSRHEGPSCHKSQCEFQSRKKHGATLSPFEPIEMPIRHYESLHFARSSQMPLSTRQPWCNPSVAPRHGSGENRSCRNKVEDQPEETKCRASTDGRAAPNHCRDTGTKNFCFDTPFFIRPVSSQWLPLQSPTIAAPPASDQ